MTKKGVERVGVSFPPELLKRFDSYIHDKGYKTRSKAICDLVRDTLTQEEWKHGRGEVIGAVSLVYNHETRDLSNKLTDLQHQAHHNVVSTTHVHIDHDNCLEILVVRGPAKKIKALGERLISTRGVLHGKMILTTTGKKM